MFIIMEADNQAVRSRQSAGKAWTARRYDAYKEGNLLSVRRPYRGIQIKDDTYATLSIRDSKGVAIALMSESQVFSNDKPPSDSKGKVNDYSDFVIQSIDEQRVEKQQIIETFGDTYVYFYGERPRVLTIRGMLVNTEDFNWRSQFWYNYDNHLRGTKLVQQNARAYLSWDTIVVEGFPLQAQASESSEMPYAVQFTMTLLLSNYYDFSNIGTVLFPQDQERNLDVANQELLNEREKYVSTTASVRFSNATATAGGFLASLRSGVQALRELNEFISDPLGGVVGALGEYGRMFTSALGGRFVRLPIGVASFLAATSDVQVAAGSIGAGTLLNEFYDSRTGTYKTLTGSVKLREPVTALFSPVGISRGFKMDNYDEYPNRKSPTLTELWERNPEAMLQEMDRQAMKKSADLRRDAEIAFWNAKAEASGWGNFLEATSLIVDGFKTGFATFTNGLALMRDWDDIIPAMFQFGGFKESFGNSWQPFNKSMFTNMLGDSLSSKKLLAVEAVYARYIGAKAAQSFRETSDNVEFVFDPESGSYKAVPVDLGTAYEGSSYVSQTDLLEKDYEGAYGDNNYQSVIDRSVADSLDEVYGGSDYITQLEIAEGTKDTLDEVYGNNDYAPDGSEIGEGELETLYSPQGGGDSGYSYVSKATMTPEERLAYLQSVLNGEDSPDDVDTSGIRGIDDQDANIEPSI